MNLSTVTATDPSLSPAIPQVSTGQVQSLLVFHLAERGYALPIEFVVQIIPMLKLTPLPQVEQMIEGVANIRGKAVPVLSARRHLGLPLVAPRLYTPIILIRTGERMMGLVVDEVADVVHVPASQVSRPEAILPEGYESAALLTGVVYQGEKAVIVLDPRFLLYPNQVRAVNKAIQAMPALEKKLAASQPGGNGNGNGHSTLPPDGPQSPAPAPCPEDAQVRVEEKPELSAVAPDNGNGNGAQPQNGHEKPRRKRRKLEAKLAGEVATLAADLPPSEGAASNGSDHGETSANLSAEDAPPSSDPQPSPGE